MYCIKYHTNISSEAFSKISYKGNNIEDTIFNCWGTGGHIIFIDFFRIEYPEKKSWGLVVISFQSKRLILGMVSIRVCAQVGLWGHKWAEVGMGRRPYALHALHKPRAIATCASGAIQVIFSACLSVCAFPLHIGLYIL